MTSLTFETREYVKQVRDQAKRQRMIAADKRTIGKLSIRPQSRTKWQERQNELRKEERRLFFVRNGFDVLDKTYIRCQSCGKVSSKYGHKQKRHLQSCARNGDR